MGGTTPWTLDIYEPLLFVRRRQVADPCCRPLQTVDRILRTLLLVQSEIIARDSTSYALDFTRRTLYCQHSCASLTHWLWSAACSSAFPGRSTATCTRYVVTVALS